MELHVFEELIRQLRAELAWNLLQGLRRLHVQSFVFSCVYHWKDGLHVSFQWHACFLQVRTDYVLFLQFQASLIEKSLEDMTDKPDRSVCCTVVFITFCLSYKKENKCASHFSLKVKMWLIRNISWKLHFFFFSDGRRQSFPTKDVSDPLNAEIDDDIYIDTKDLCRRIAWELKQHSIPQAVFAERILCRYVSNYHLCFYDLRRTVT